MSKDKGIKIDGLEFFFQKAIIYKKNEKSRY